MGLPSPPGGRVFSVVVHGDVEGAENVRRSISDWLRFMHLCPAGPTAELDRYIGYWKPYATSSMPIPRSRTRYATRPALCWRQCVWQARRHVRRRRRESAPAAAEIVARPRSSRAVAVDSQGDLLYLFDGLGGTAPASSASVASKNFSSSLIALAGRRRMSCRSPSKGERSGTTNTRSLRSFLPFDD
jgi:hypothetical protein